MPKNLLPVVVLFLALSFSVSGETDSPLVNIPESSDHIEVERLIKTIANKDVQRRIEFVSKYFLGRKYRPETKKRIQQQRTVKPAVKKEATNAQPLPVTIVRTSSTYLDCMTYVEHVMAVAASDAPDYEKSFLNRLIDIVYRADGAPLMSHHRNHFTSMWADINEQKGYVTNIARGHPAAVTRELFLNRVGTNRTFYVKDSFMIAAQAQIMWYFPVESIFKGLAPMESGDIVAMVTDKEGLDVTHMGFYVEHDNQKWLRHASLKLNRVMDEDFEKYLRAGSHVKGLMVLRPVLKASMPATYRFSRTKQ